MYDDLKMLKINGFNKDDYLDINKNKFDYEFFIKINELILNKSKLNINDKNVI